MMMGGGMTLGLLLLLLLVVGVPLLLLIAAGVLVWLNRGSLKNAAGGSRRGSGDTPREILDRRLARGEIDMREYREILSEINDGGSK